MRTSNLAAIRLSWLFTLVVLGLTQTGFAQSQPDKVQPLLALEQTFPGDRMSARQFRHHLASPRARWRVAEAGGKLLGYSLVLLRRDSDRARLYSIAVDPAARGHPRRRLRRRRACGQGGAV